MVRIAPLEPPYTPDLHSQFDVIMHGKPPLVLFRTLATSERAWEKFRAGSLLARGPLTLRQREIVIDRTCARCGCEYEWGVHVATFSDRAGLNHDEIGKMLAVPFDAAGWNEPDAILIETVDALHERASIPDDTFVRLGRQYDEAQILEIIMLAGFYRTVSYLANGLAMPLEPDAARFADFAF